jgi:hypothetical protein
MEKSRFTDRQIVAVLKGAEAGGRCRSSVARTTLEIQADRIALLLTPIMNGGLPPQPPTIWRLENSSS